MTDYPAGHEARGALERYDKYLKNNYECELLTPEQFLVGGDPLPHSDTRGALRKQFLNKVQRKWEQQPPELIISNLERIPADIFYFYDSNTPGSKWLHSLKAPRVRMSDFLYRLLGQDSPHQTMRNRLKKIIAPSELVRAKISEWDAQIAEKVEVVYPGCDQKIYRPASTAKSELRAQLQLEHTNPLILFPAERASRNDLQTSLHFFQHTCRILEKQERFPTLVLWVDRVAQASVLKTIEKTLPKPQQEAVKCYPRPADEQKWFQAASVLLQPTATHPFAMDTLKALCCGCPAITTEYNGAAELIYHENNGYILNAYGTTGLKEAASWWLRHRLTPDQIASGTELFDLNQEAGQVEDCLREVLQIPRKHAPRRLNEEVSRVFDSIPEESH